MRERFEQLDALRGLAALAVLLEHFLQVYPSIGDPGNWNSVTSTLIHSPLKMFWGGHEAVIFFFVLSGFVLSLPYYKNKELPYFTFVKRRVFRIYMPYLAAIFVGLVVSLVLSKSHLPTISNWFNNLGTNDISPGLVINHIFLIGGDYDYKAFNSVIWTLIHEMRIALVFPVLMLLVMRLKINFLIPLCIVFSLVGFVSNNMLLSPEHGPIYYLITIHYVSMFVIGALLAKHRELLTSKFRSLSSRLKASIMVLGLLLYSYSYWFLPGFELLHKRIIDDWVISAGVAVIILVSLTSQKAQSLLAFKPIAFLGKISYSFYLYHLIVLTACLRLLAGSMPIYLILIMAFAVSLVVSYLSYRFVELPSINLGKKAFVKLQERTGRGILDERA